MIATVLGTAVAAACSSPPPAAPAAGQVSGAWVANTTLTTASGGECIGADLRNLPGRRDVLLAALAGESTISATITSQGNGTSCAYSGSNANGVLNVSCSTGDRRDVQLVAGTLQAQADSRVGTGSGSDTTTWNVFAAGSQQPVGVLSVTEAFTWVYLGLPPSDYHTFTGTVFPGYADGTISIPADPNPWCLPCGWFH